MKLIRFILLICFILVICNRVIDGDTIVVLIHNEEFLVRLVGYDAPEFKSKYRDVTEEGAEEAKEHLEELVLNKEIDLIIVGLDKYKRLLGYVFVGETYVNDEMLNDPNCDYYY
jgi:endonuclease YncB( thermonuclease family)